MLLARYQYLLVDLLGIDRMSRDCDDLHQSEDEPNDGTDRELPGTDPSERHMAKRTAYGDVSTKYGSGAHHRPCDSNKMACNFKRSLRCLFTPYTTASTPSAVVSSSCLQVSLRSDICTRRLPHINQVFAQDLHFKYQQLGES